MSTTVASHPVRRTAARDRVVAATTSLFSHGPQPLERTMDFAGDPGLLGPDSVSWRVLGDPSAFVGGIRALLVQTLHPEVMAGVEAHSSYQADPLGRLSRTAFYVTQTTYGSRPEVDEAVAAVRRAHRPVRGQSGRGRPYRADDPALAAWVHNVLTESFLSAYRSFGGRPLSDADADRFVVEQAQIGALLGADPLPGDAVGLGRWLLEHPSLERTAAQGDAVRFLRRPPLPIGVGAAYRVLSDAAVSTIPPAQREALDLRVRPGAHRVGSGAVRMLRWALGCSPSWHLALVRSGAEIPPGVFRQPLPADVDPS